MGWLKDAWNSVTEWVHDKIVEPVVDWVKEVIHDTTVVIRIWRHEFNKLMSKWLENDFVFFALIAATITGAFLLPQIITWVNKLTITIALKAAWKDVQEGWIDVLDFIHIVELDTINTILNVFWPDWKAMTAQLTDVTSKLAKELGKSCDYLQAYFAVIHGIAIVENSFIGADPKLAEMQAFEDTAAALQKIDDKFYDYAENPSLIVSDLIEDFYLPRAENINIAQQDVIDSARDSRDRIVGINAALHDFEGRLTHFIEMTPDEMQEIISKRLQPIADALAAGLYVMDTEIMPKVNGVIDALALQTDRQNTINANVIARMGDPYSFLLQNELFGAEDQKALQDYLAELNRRSVEEGVEENVPALDAVTEAMIEATKGQYEEAPPVVQPARTALSFEMPGIPPAGAIPSWFQGEY